MLNDLLRKDFIVHYNITSKDVVVDYQTTAAEEFDLDDMPSPIKILPLGKGGLSFEGNSEQIEVVHYEDFIAQCKKPQVFANGRKRCDYVVCSMRQAENKGHVILAELTSALGGAYNLARPIRKGQDLEYRGGKYEKAAKQLGINKIALAGGVSANSYIRAKFIEFEQTEGFKIYYPEPILCTDNAAMIASAGYYNFIKGKKSDLYLNAIPNLKLGEEL